MAFMIMQCEMDGEAVKFRRIVADFATTMEAAESLVARVAQSHVEAGFDGASGYWWARDPLGKEYRFVIERSAMDETDGV